MFNKKKTARSLAKIILNPDLSFFTYFLFVALFGLSGKDLLVLYAVIFPWLVLVIIFLNMPFFRILFAGLNITEDKKINHVLEHGTIYFLEKHYGIKHKLGGSALDNGFRIHGVKSKKDISQAFEKLREYLEKSHTGIVLSKFCGSNVHILQGVSLILLTLTFICFVSLDIDLLRIQIILLFNLISYILFRHPIGKYFQKKLTMSFNFSDAQIISLKKSKKQGIFERNPVYFVRTKVQKFDF